MNNIFSKFPKSTYIKGLEWIGERIPYSDMDITGDTYPMTWADDDEIYTSCGDPMWGKSPTGLDVEKISGDPIDYKITKVDEMEDYVGLGGAGPKPCGMICVDGVLYLAFQNLLGNRKPVYGVVSQHCSDSYIICSSNKGLHWWTPDYRGITEPMFPGNKFGSPAFINFGKNNEYARDHYVYAVSGDQWDNGSNLRLGRVPKDRIIEPSAWEWVCAFTPDGEPAWSYILEDAIPILSLHRHLGMPEMVYMADIKRYLLFTWRLHKDFSPYDGTDLIVLESPQPWGPFSLVHYEEYWEGKELNPYAPRVPLKWVESDGITGWLQFSGTWSQEGQDIGAYRSHVRKFKLQMRGEESV